MNLFLSTRALTDAREDHLTEFFAAALYVSDSFRRSYYDLVIANYAERQGWGQSHITGLQTQVSYKETTCCPDMILRLSNGKIVACEHKLDALETLGPEQDERGQLERYLDLPIDALIYIRTSWKPPISKVLMHPKYIQHPEREHFLWRDFYPLLKAQDHAVVGWLKEGFERLGFTPPHPSIGEMTGPNEEMVKENRRNFAKLWGRTRSLAHGLGWKVGSGSIVELYLSGSPTSPASEIFVSPAKFDRFLFRVTPREGNLKRIKESLNLSLEGFDGKLSAVEREVLRKSGKEKVIDLTTSLREILGNDALQPEEIETRLAKFLEPLLSCLT